jgi:hypothetical protein
VDIDEVMERISQILAEYEGDERELLEALLDRCDDWEARLEELQGMGSDEEPW